MLTEISPELLFDWIVLVIKESSLSISVNTLVSVIVVFAESSLAVKSDIAFAITGASSISDTLTVNVSSI